jgi:hypothetical protein
MPSFGRAGRTFVLGLVPGFVMGCSGSAPDDRPRQAVSGEVTLDGKPLDNAQIVFDPKSKTDGVGAFGTIVEGHFSIAKSEGPVPGSYFVRISSAASTSAAADHKPGELKKFDLSTPKDLIPPQFNSDTKLSADVKSDAPNVYEFALTSAPESRPDQGKVKRPRRP